jgi:hypothetical protein
MQSSSFGERVEAVTVDARDMRRMSSLVPIMLPPEDVMGDYRSPSEAPVEESPEIPDQNKVWEESWEKHELDVLNF